MSDPSFHALAVDLGAESGRVMLGAIEGGTLNLTELHRFPSAMCRINGSLRWDVLRLFEEIKEGLREAGCLGKPIASVSTDSWGVDYVLMRGEEPLLAVPFHYRDERTDGAFERIFPKVSQQAIFESTGIQFMELNTLYQLHEDAEDRRELLEASDGFLNIADYFNWLMSGTRKAEVSLASTTQLYNPRSGEWARDIAEQAGIPGHLFPEIADSGTPLGPLRTELADELRLTGTQVVSGLSHDTAAAVMAVPAETGNWAFLSSGTWSLLGVERPEPLINEASQTLNFTNEAGFGGTTRFLKNLVGLWILQECRRCWAEAGDNFTYDELTKLASGAASLSMLIRPDAPEFAKPGHMPEKIADYCARTNQPSPATQAQYIRCIIDSLALLYGENLRQLRNLTGSKIDRIHIVGGGSRNALLNQATATATRCEVLAGPVEATAMGNILSQAFALKSINSIEEARQIVRNSISIETYAPERSEKWEEAERKFEELPQQ